MHLWIHASSHFVCSTLSHFRLAKFLRRNSENVFNQRSAVVSNGRKTSLIEASADDDASIASDRTATSNSKETVC